MYRKMYLPSICVPTLLISGVQALYLCCLFNTSDFLAPKIAREWKDQSLRALTQHSTLRKMQLYLAHTREHSCTHVDIKVKQEHQYYALISFLQKY